RAPHKKTGPNAAPPSRAPAASPPAGPPRPTPADTRPPEPPRPPPRQPAGTARTGPQCAADSRTAPPPDQKASSAHPYRRSWLRDIAPPRPARHPKLPEHGRRSANRSALGWYSTMATCDAWIGAPARLLIDAAWSPATRALHAA